VDRGTGRSFRAGRLTALDVANVVEELEDMGRSQRQQLENRLEVLLCHMLKKQYQPKKHKRGWDATIDEQRRAIQRLLRDSLSLKRNLLTRIREIYPDAVSAAVHETDLKRNRFPAELPYELATVLPGL
jgi:hypothetical protein